MQKVVAGVLCLGLAACTGGMITVTTKPATLSSGEVFWAKNTIAEKTGRPGSARFRDFFAVDLSNGDRVYCGEMNISDGHNNYVGFVPFYMRRSDDRIVAANWVRDSAEFSKSKCDEARSGRLRINNI